MKAVLNDKEIIFPSSLAEFTLGQRIAFQEQYGNELDKMKASITEMPAGMDREIETLEFHFEKMFRTFSFFAGTTVDAVKECEFIEEVAAIYNSCTAILFDDDKDQEPKKQFVFAGEQWELATPELKHGDKMTFGEVIDSKQIIKDLVEVGKSRWEYMLPLCVIYLRKKGEAYKEEFLYEGSDRLELMKSLPMDIAMQVGFFLINSMNLSMRILTSSKGQERREPVSMSNIILTDGVGLIS